jgi:hypothetical protein
MRRLMVIAGLVFCTAAQAQSNAWDSLENKGARYAGTRNDRQDAVIFVCPVTGAPQMIVRSPQFRVSVPDEHRYTLTFVTDHGRNEVTAVSQDAELVLDGTDLNAQFTLQRLMEEIATSQRFTVSMSPFGWKGEFTGEGAAAALKPMIGGC